MSHQIVFQDNRNNDFSEKKTKLMIKQIFYVAQIMMPVKGEDLNSL